MAFSGVLTVTSSCCMWFDLSPYLHDIIFLSMIYSTVDIFVFSRITISFNGMFYCRSGISHNLVVTWARNWDFVGQLNELKTHLARKDPASDTYHHPHHHHPHHHHHCSGGNSQLCLFSSTKQHFFPLIIRVEKVGCPCVRLNVRADTYPLTGCCLER